jgi:hypothetical protein
MSTFEPLDDIVLSDYSDKSIVITGETKKYKDELKAFEGKWNGRLKCGPGWIFPKTKKSILEKWINTGQKIIINDDKTVANISNTSFHANTNTNTNNLEKKVEKLTEKLDIVIWLLSQKFNIDINDYNKSSSSNISIELEEDSDDEKPLKKLL